MIRLYMSNGSPAIIQRGNYLLYWGMGLRSVSNSFGIFEWRKEKREGEWRRRMEKEKGEGERRKEREKREGETRNEKRGARNEKRETGNGERETRNEKLKRD